jgi:hypothetical protein
LFDQTKQKLVESEQHIARTRDILERAESITHRSPLGW